jgi:uncharacterized protein (DUF2336 family)
MSSPVSLISELEDVILHGSPGRLAAALQGITTLFLEGAARFNQDHLDLFDDVFLRLIACVEPRARLELSCRLAPLDNAPMQAICRLAQDDDISVARPVLEQSRRLDDGILTDIAERMTQGHLLALSNRKGLNEALADVLVRRGDRSVVHSLAQNDDARLSERSLATLVYQAGYDDVLAEKIGLRHDVPPSLFRELLSRATVGVQQRLLTLATPKQQTEIKTVLATMAGKASEASGPRDFTNAYHLVEAHAREGRLDATGLLEFATTGQYEVLVVALSQLCSVPVEVVDRLLQGDRTDPVMILCKSAGCGWPTVKAIIAASPGHKEQSSQSLDEAFTNFERLTLATAQRVVRFWQIRQPNTGA